MNGWLNCQYKWHCCARAGLPCKYSFWNWSCCPVVLCTIGAHARIPSIRTPLWYSCIATQTHLMPHWHVSLRGYCPNVVEVNNSSCHSCYRLDGALTVHLVTTSSYYDSFISPWFRLARAMCLLITSLSSRGRAMRIKITIDLTAQLFHGIREWKWCAS